jgi:hypothetical protein
MPNGKTRRAAVSPCRRCLAQMFPGPSNAFEAGFEVCCSGQLPLSQMTWKCGTCVALPLDGQIPGGQCRMDADVFVSSTVFVLGKVYFPRHRLDLQRRVLALLVTRWTSSLNKHLFSTWMQQGEPRKRRKDSPRSGWVTPSSSICLGAGDKPGTDRRWASC